MNTYTANADVSSRMHYVIEAARKNIEQRTGGPFAAAIFEKDSGELVSLGINLVTTEGMSILHAEIVAISLAQRILGTYDLGCNALPPFDLVTSTEPCAMCFGAIIWSGVRRVITGAREEDARHIGFDEGAKVPHWRIELENRGIETVCDIGRCEAIKALTEYVACGGHIYNSRVNYACSGDCKN
jgi:tRNA(Arg) A34 adenosine deaminase TadA